MRNKELATGNGHEAAVVLKHTDQEGLTAVTSRPGSSSRHRSGTPSPSVMVREEEVSLPTYLPAPPDKNPMFMEKRVYQGSSGKVYPLPFTDRIAEKPVDRKWKAIWIENE